ncbi:MAG: hypothetical protein CMO55_05910 [Verrucomicrobiales bacterium]|nr:hypothetical protein [Verrucomicrobiales bacterium]
MASKSDKRRPLAVFLAPVLTAGLMALVWPTDFVRELENVTMDWRFRARADTDPAPDPRIALVGIGDQSLKEWGRWQDWTRKNHAAFLAALALNETRIPKVVAYDFFFPEKSLDTSADEAFASYLELHPGAITGVEIIEKEVPEPSRHFDWIGKTIPLSNVTGEVSNLLGGDDANAPIEAIAEASWTGMVNCPPSKLDGMRRKLPFVGRIGENVYPSFVLQIIMQWEEVSPDEVTVVIGDSVTIPRSDGSEYKVPIDGNGFFTINYRNTDRFNVVDYVALAIQSSNSSEGAPWPEDIPPIKDQILVVGQSAVGLSDFGATPYSAQAALFMVQATALDSILRGDFMTEFPKLWIILAWLAIAWATLISLRRAPIIVEIAVPVVIIVGFVLLCFFVFEHFSLSVPMFLPILGFALIHTTVIGDRLVTELKEKRRIKGMFSSYVSPDLVQMMVASGETPELGGKEVEITVLFSDIQGFSGFSEVLSPKELVDIMVEYLSSLTDIMQEQGGTLDKYIGDAIDGMFGAPLSLPDHAYQGVKAAILMQREQEELCKIWQQREGTNELVKTMRTRIGLNSGVAVVGNIGSARRFNYTMMGDNVNLGARLESGAKTYGVYTMVSHDTRNAAQATRDDIIYRYIDKIQVMGRTQPVEVHEVLEYKDRVTQETLDCIEIYSSALELYMNQEWDKAIEQFKKSANLELFQPNRDPGIKTNPSLMMANRCDIMKISPPEKDWDGVYRMTTK